MRKDEDPKQEPKNDARGGFPEKHQGKPIPEEPKAEPKEGEK